MKIYDIKLEEDTVVLTFDDQTVKTYKEVAATTDSPSEEVVAEPVVEATEPVESPVEPVVEAEPAVEAPVEPAA